MKDFLTILLFVFTITISVLVTSQLKKIEIPIQSVNEISQVLNLGYVNLTNDETDYYGMMFAKYANKYNIDWCIYPAIITVESNWDASSVSDSGAKGVPQMMDSTFKLECKRYRIHYDEKKTIQNDVILLGRGLEYLSRMVKAKGIERGVKSYIGGPNYHESNKDVQLYWLKFKAEYSKVITLCKEHKKNEVMIINKAFNN